MTKNDDNPWQTLDSNVTYQNSWMTVHEDGVLMPSGKRGIYGFVESKPGVFVIALNDVGEMYLIESFRYPTQKWQWELPTGGIEKGLTALEAAKQELAEELGMLADKWTHVNTFGPSHNGLMNDVQQVFLAENLRKDESSQPEESEAIRAIKTVDLPGVIKMIRDAELTGAQTLAAIIQYFAWRGYGGL